MKCLINVLITCMLLGGVNTAFALHSATKVINQFSFTIKLAITHSWDPCPRDFGIHTTVTPSNVPFTVNLNSGRWSASATGTHSVQLLNNHYWNYGVVLGENTWDVTVKGHTVRRKFFYNSSPCYWYPDTTETISYP